MTELEKTSFAKTQLPLIFRGIVAFMFLLSAVAKLYPSPYFALTTFETKQLIPMGFNASVAAYFSRILVGCELALGILLLQKHFYKKLVLPASFLMLFVFSVHLAYEISQTGNAGNCGCFGALLPMTPVQALIKNIIAMAMIGYIFRLAKATDDKTNFPILTTATFGAVLTIFLIAPLARKSAQSGEVVEAATVNEPGVNTPTNSLIDTAKAVVPEVKPGVNPTATTAEELVDEPKPKKSGFKSVYGDIDKGRKILCFFAPGCDHCKEAAKELTQLKNQLPDFPEMKIAFMDEEAELIPDFFAFAGQKYTYKVLDVGTFWTAIGGSRDTPGVFYLWNGNIVKAYDGINEKAFKKSEFKAIVQKKWSELKK